MSAGDETRACCGILQLKKSARKYIYSDEGNALVQYQSILCSIPVVQF